MKNHFEQPAAEAESEMALPEPEEKRRRINDLKNIWRGKRDLVSDNVEQLEELDQIRANFVTGLEGKFGREVYNYELYYLIAQKTIPASCQYFDWPDEFSVEKFIKETL
ncbi:MAG: hypothetical protein AAB645_02870 [Patescibacteria group bacterium]